MSINGLSDKLPHRAFRDFGNELFNMEQTSASVISVNGADSAGVSSIPSLEHVGSLFSPDLANDENIFAGRNSLTYDVNILI